MFPHGSPSNKSQDHGHGSSTIVTNAGPRYSPHSSGPGRSGVSLVRSTTPGGCPSGSPGDAEASGGTQVVRWRCRALVVGATYEPVTLRRGYQFPLSIFNRRHLCPDSSPLSHPSCTLVAWVYVYTCRGKDGAAKGAGRPGFQANSTTVSSGRRLLTEADPYVADAYFWSMVCAFCVPGRRGRHPGQR